MNEYQIAAIAGCCIAALWIVAYVFSWSVQWGWSWIDDSKVGKRNWLANKLNYSKWKYPVYLYCEDEVFGYAKDKKHDGQKGLCDLDHGVDYIYNHETGVFYWKIGFVVSLLPIASVIAFKIYPITLTCGVLIILAHVARFSRRHKKIFEDHVKDKNAHK